MDFRKVTPDTINYIKVMSDFVLILLNTFQTCTHHQPINVPTARAQAFLMDYT
jgi:hypothetical protein